MSRALLFSLVLFLPLALSAQKAVPELWGQRVHDEAKVLSSSTISQLENQLKVYEDSTSNQLAILIIPSLDGDVLEEYSIRVVDKWKLGKKTKDNGVLLLIAIDDHKIRIEVGEGLEGVLTDALSNRIIRNEIAPPFRRGDYDEGVQAGVHGIIRAIGGEYTADEDGTNASTAIAEDLGVGGVIFLGLFIFGILGLFTFIGIFSGKPGWFLYFFLIPFWGLFPTIFLGTSIYVLYTYLVGFPLLKILLGKSEWGKQMTKKMASSNGGRSGGGWSSGGGWYSGGGGWSSGGGGFSGGGGSFGGGGSSGSW